VPYRIEADPANPRGNGAPHVARLFLHETLQDYVRSRSTQTPGGSVGKS
jgi:hypothetical protein